MSTETYPRCGSPLVPLEELADLARTIAGEAERVRVGFERMHLVVPQMVVLALRALERDGPTLVSGLNCHAARCEPRRLAS